MSIAKREQKVAIVGCESVDAIDVRMLATRSGADEILLVGAGNRIQADVVNRLRVDGSATKFANITPADIEDAAKADIVVVAGGPGPEPAEGGSPGIREVIANVQKNIRDLMHYGFDGILLVTVYPTDVMTKVAQLVSGLPTSRLIGIGLEGNKWYSTHGSVGETVWCSALCSHVDFFDDCHPQCPHFRSSSVRQPIQIENSNYTGGLATCVSGICEAILSDQNQIYPVSVIVERPANGRLCMTLPCVVGRAGVKAILGKPQPTDSARNRKLSSNHKLLERPTMSDRRS
jgi:malate/lactate dehydrogenase